jgi:hypothetical protein
MNTQFYNINGIPSPKPESDFWVTNNGVDFVISKNDIIGDIDMNCIMLQHEVGNIIFDGIEKLHSMQLGMPMWIPYAGIDGDLKVSKEQFEILINKSGANTELYKLLYYYDVSNLIGTFQNSVQETKTLFCQFYEELNTNSFMFTNQPIEPNGIMFASGRLVTSIFSKVNHLFISLYSQLDFLAKITYEVENLQSIFNTYPKLKSSKILFGDSKKTKLHELENTVFEKSVKNIKIIQALRNEIVHNASFENIPKVFQHFENNKMIEKFIFLPDFDDDGIIKTFKSRKRFFGMDIKLNIILPDLIFDLWKRQLETIKELKKAMGNTIYN